MIAHSLFDGCGYLFHSYRNFNLLIFSLAPRGIGQGATQLLELCLRNGAISGLARMAVNSLRILSVTVSFRDRSSAGQAPGSALKYGAGFA